MEDYFQRILVAWNAHSGHRHVYNVYGRAIVTSCYRLHRMEEECHEVAVFDSSVVNISVELSVARNI